MELIDNITRLLGDDLKATLKPNALAACFDSHGGVDEALVKELAKVQPLRVVFRDAGFKDSSVKINVEQIFKLLSPATEVKCI